MVYTVGIYGNCSYMNAFNVRPDTTEASLKLHNPYKLQFGPKGKVHLGSLLAIHMANL